MHMWECRYLHYQIRERILMQCYNIRIESESELLDIPKICIANPARLCGYVPYNLCFSLPLSNQLTVRLLVELLGWAILLSAPVSRRNHSITRMSEDSRWNCATSMVAGFPHSRSGSLSEVLPSAGYPWLLS